MKKLFSLISILLCAVMLATTAFAASVDADAYTLYQNSVKKLKAASSMEFSTAIRSFDSDGTEYSAYRRALRMVRTSDKKLLMQSVTIDTHSPRPDYSYYKDGYIHTARGDGAKYKIKDLEEEFFTRALGLYFNLNGFEDEFIETKVEKFDGGTKIIRKWKVEDTIDPKDYGVPGDPVTDGMSYNLTITLTHDGMLKSCVETYMTYTDDSTGRFIRSKDIRSINIKSVNSEVTIDFPSDLGTYKELILDN